MTDTEQGGVERGRPPLVGENCRYFLARRSGPMAVDLVDGCHDTPESVAKAAKLYGRIFGDAGPWLMVKVEDVPDCDPEINEDAARFLSTHTKEER